MGFRSVLAFAHLLVRERLRPGDLAVDATLGNGNDTLFLCRRVDGPGGHVYGFDIQPEAIRSTRERLAREGVPEERYTLIEGNHADMARLLPPEAAGRVKAVMFNLGFLPGGDPSVITVPDTTLPALDGALELLAPGGIVTAVVYPGHPGGDREAAAVEAWAARLPPERFRSLCYRFLNAAGRPPYLIAVVKRT